MDFKPKECPWLIQKQPSDINKPKKAQIGTLYKAKRIAEEIFDVSKFWIFPNKIHHKQTLFTTFNLICFASQWRKTS